MKAQIPAQGIMKKGSFGDTQFYEISCSCGQPDHIHSVQVEADDMGVTVNIWTRQSTDVWNEPFKSEYTGENNFLYKLTRTFKDAVNGAIRRVSLTWQVWAKGYVTYEVTTVMDEQEALNYSAALKAAVADVKKFKEGKDKK
jgi:hypothetical protein